ncbi:MAG: peptidoglycan DD-metalloendopeptidase family protein [Acidiferrobacteraceae bacterium]
MHGWIWPTKGAVVGGFSRTGVNKGIDIAGRRGSDILAASGGSVVYQGSGLRGYGKLIIIKHNADFLSAYAHCARILVRDGESVKRGQRIATMGSSGTNRVKLHFEIRLRGKPVNPLRYLPGKS